MLRGDTGFWLNQPGAGDLSGGGVPGGFPSRPQSASTAFAFQAARCTPALSPD